MRVPTKVQRWCGGATIILLSLLLGLGSLAIQAPASAAAVRGEAGVHTVEVGGITLAYRSLGHGRPLVLLQGSGAAMDVWDPLMIQTLAHDRRVIIFDYRGVGFSSDDPSVPMTIDLLAHDTAGLIRALHLGRADVLGWSMGGFVAQRLAELHPHRVGRLILMSTDPGSKHAVRAAPDILALDERVTTGQASLDEILFLLFPPDQLEAGQAWLDRYFSQPGCCESVPYETAVRQLGANDAWYAGPGAWRSLPRIHRPTLVLRGALDIDVPPVNGALIARRLPDATSATFDDAGHGLPLQEPTTVGGIVNGFLERP